ncbi:cation transporter [Neptunitalea lumnitzerae]|uniref:HMA domain-containing protein n=1 Tax=Neptunitalea lumnitzerae TaxID=2965509 RepID=A0ABQ5MG71_9FLAO|nr:heavy metal-associated domain-containing protein [Neptunitalea sp. Y10]GLB48400.1 hypothetical protein Y10_07680 [Neptunitalea sp. Y10]
MKKIFYYVSVACILLTVSCNTATKEQAAKTEVAAANISNTEFNIDGMTCAVGCAATIEKQLNELDGVQQAKVDFENKKASVAFDSTKLSLEAIATTVTTIGDGHTYKVYNMAKTDEKAHTCTADCSKGCTAEKKENCTAKTKAAGCNGKAKMDCCAKKTT